MLSRVQRNSVGEVHDNGMGVINENDSDRSDYPNASIPARCMLVLLPCLLPAPSAALTNTICSNPGASAQAVASALVRHSLLLFTLLTVLGLPLCCSFNEKMNKIACATVRVVFMHSHQAG
mgnify:CR=1 FL=1